MKKTVVAFILGAALMFTTTVAAQEINSLIGKKVTKEYDITVDGKKLSNRVIAVDGVTYAPIREFAEKLDRDVSFDSKTGVTILKKGTVKNDVSSPPDTSTDVYIQLSTKKENLKSIKNRLSENETIMQSSKEFYNANNMRPDGPVYEETSLYERYMKLINDDKELIKNLESEIAALESQIQPAQ